ARVAADVHQQRPAITALIAALDPARDPSAALRLRAVQGDPEATGALRRLDAAKPQFVGDIG
ncbi:MAG: hypothetical protein JO321_16400, partial [Solirubrobacterales bacterium]|nr:hypothetical protein [Solirubrobacterales bacterium]